MIGKTIHNLEIISELGKGGMGTVYLAKKPVLGHFAMKALDPILGRNQEFRERFKNETQTQFKLKHDNIVNLHDFIEDGENLYLILEYINGISLEELIRKRGSLPEKEALSIAKDVLNGLNYANSKGIIHRDIKPSNILITKKGRAKIMDFGIARIMGTSHFTRTGALLGTAHYMSPEQVKGLKTIDHRSDVYAMGIVLYEMLTGNPPFDADTDYEIYKHHEFTQPRSLAEAAPNISLILSQLVKKALEKDPDRRFDGCGDFLNYLEAYERGGYTGELEDEAEKNKQAKDVRAITIVEEPKQTKPTVFETPPKRKDNGRGKKGRVNSTKGKNYSYEDQIRNGKKGLIIATVFFIPGILSILFLIFYDGVINEDLGGLLVLLIMFLIMGCGIFISSFFEINKAKRIIDKKNIDSYS